MRHRVLLRWFAVLAWIVSAVPALAHATLLRSLPEANASLERAPTRVELYFSEAVEISFSTIRVLNASGARMDGADTQVDPADPTHLFVSLKTLPDGVYTVSWRALSTDGHVTTGAYPFAVGVAASLPATTESATSTESTSWGEVLARALVYLGASALLGGSLFLRLIWAPVAGARLLTDTAVDREQRRRQAFLQVFGYLLAFVGSALGLLAKAGQLSGTPVDWPWSTAMVATLFDTRFGLLWLLRIVVLMIALAASRGRGAWRSSWTGWTALLGWGLLVAMNSHAAAEAEPFLPVLADWAHLMGAALWIGGLTAFVIAQRSLRDVDLADRLRATALLIPRFSMLAMACVATLVITGIYAAAARVGSLSNLLFSTYGQVLAVKLVLVAPMIVIGAVHVLRIRPQMRQATDRPDGWAWLVGRFTWLVRTEVILGAAALATAGLLTSSAPALPLVNAPGLNATALADDLTLQLNVNPGAVGVNQFALTVLAYGQPATDVTDVVLRFTPASGDLAPTEVPLAYQGNGRFTLTGAYLSLAGSWNVRVAVRRIGFYDTFATFELPMTAGAPLPPGPAIDAPRPQMAAALLALLAMAWLVVMGTLMRSRLQWLVLGWLPALALLVCSYLAISRPDSSQTAAGAAPRQTLMAEAPTGGFSKHEE